VLKIKIHRGESIEKALKRFKRKFIRTKVTKELRRRSEFKKKSVKRREEILKAKYVEKLRRESGDY